MNPDRRSPGELVRPVTEPTVVAKMVGASDPVSSGTASAFAPTPLGLLRALHRRQALAVGVALLAAGISGVAAWFLVPGSKFRAQARLQVAAQPPKVLFRTVETENLGEDYRRYQNTQQTLVKSQLVLNAALHDDKISKYRMVAEQADPITWLKDKLGVEFVAASEVMEISLSGDDPVEIAGLVNAIQKAYMEEVVHKDTKIRAERYAKLRRIKERYGETLKDQHEMLRKLAETAGSNNPQTLAWQQQLVMEYQARIRNELLDIQSQKRKLEARLKTKPRSAEPAAEAPVRTVSEADVEAAIDQHPTIAKLTARLAAEQDQLAAGQANFRAVARNGPKKGDPTLKRLRDAVVETARVLEQQRKALRPVAVRQLEQQEVSEQLVRGDETERELQMLTDLEQRLSAEVAKLTVDNQSQTHTTLNLELLQEEIDQAKKSAGQVATEVEALNVELEAPPRIRPIEDATVPRTKDEKKRFMMIGMIVFGAFVAGLFGIAFLELQSHKVDSSEEVLAFLGLPIVGALPILPSKASRKVVGIHRERDRYLQNVLLESIDTTRTMLVHAARTGSHRVVMIASAVAGEGKTSLASYLATSLARSGLRTLLIDADLRSPGIHRLFDLPVSAGLSELLRSEVSLANAIADTAIPDLKILTAGRCDRPTIRLLAQGGLSSLFAQLKEQFDFVVVDSSPLLPVADSMLIAQQVDAVLLSIFCEVSCKTKVMAAAQRLQCLGVRILGAVVTGGHGILYGSDYYRDSYYSALPESADRSIEPGS
jgi:capsular exopolysaccharide synthesis family protein